MSFKVVRRIPLTKSLIKKDHNCFNNVITIGIYSLFAHFRDKFVHLCAENGQIFKNLVLILAINLELML
ncbi:hypothetical protein VPHK120G1_0004 [Vibrio phage K120 g1]